MSGDRASADEIEVEIKWLPKGGFRATVHSFRGGRWWPPDSKLFVSELEAMRWINSRLALQGFEEAYPLTCKQFIEGGVRERKILGTQGAAMLGGLLPAVLWVGLFAIIFSDILQNDMSENQSAGRARRFPSYEALTFCVSLVILFVAVWAWLTRRNPFPRQRP